MVAAGTRRDVQRWYRVAAERNVVTFKLEWTTVCVPESRVGSLSSSDQDSVLLARAGIYGRFAYTHRGNTRRRTYGRRIVFKTAGGSQALEPSCDLVLHNERVPSRSVSRRNFNTLVYLTNVRPFPASSLSILRSFSSRPASSLLRSFYFFFSFYYYYYYFYFYFVFFFFSFFCRFLRLIFARRFFVLLPYMFLFPWSFFRFSRYTGRENSFVGPRNRLFVFPRRAQKRDPGRHVVAVRLESGIYCQLNGPVLRPPYPGRSF